MAHEMIQDLFSQIKALCRDYGPVISAFMAISVCVLGYILQRRARRIASLMAWKSHRDEIRSYAEEVIDVLSSLEGLCEAKPEILKQEFWNRRSDLMSKLSSLRDRGRLLLPNLNPDQHGSSKSEAYRGYRQRAIDCLSAAFWIASSIDCENQKNNKDPVVICLPIPEDATQLTRLWGGLMKLPKLTHIKPGGPDLRDQRPGWSSKRALIESKRQFVSEIQVLIDPRRWISEIVALVPGKDM
jgi:hypothetical protein